MLTYTLYSHQTYYRARCDDCQEMVACYLVWDGDRSASRKVCSDCYGYMCDLDRLVTQMEQTL